MLRSRRLRTLLKSTSAGSSWSGVVTGLTLDLRRVRMAGSPDRIVVGGGCSLRRSDDGGATFQRLPFSASDFTCPSPVGAFSFPSSNVWYVVLGNNAVLSTADGGQTFTRRTAVPVIPAATDLLCTSDTTCFATSGGSIQRTTDGAVTWTQVAQFGLPLFGLEQADATTLYAVGQALHLLKSTDGGATWERKTVAGVPGGDFGSIRCSDADNCLLAMRQGNRIVKTMDGGDTFTAATPPAESAFAVELASATRALAVGNFGSAVLSDDGGETWRVVGGRLTDDFTVLEGATDRIAYAGRPLGRPRADGGRRAELGQRQPADVAGDPGRRCSYSLAALRPGGGRDRPAIRQRRRELPASQHRHTGGSPGPRRDRREPRGRHRLAASVGRSTAARRSRPCPTATSVGRAC